MSEARTFRQPIVFGDSVRMVGSSGIGYGTGSGSTVTQITNRATGVTINAICGAITTDTTSLAAEASADFVVTNSAVAIGDVRSISTTRAIRTFRTSEGSFPRREIRGFAVAGNGPRRLGGGDGPGVVLE